MVIQAEIKEESPAVDWGAGNAEGRQRASDLIEKMQETGDITLLLGECRRMTDPFYGAVGVGFFSYLASTLVSR